jgi:hypothetical protein
VSASHVLAFTLDTVLVRCFVRARPKIIIHEELAREVSKCKRDYRLFKIHRVTKQKEQFMRHSVEAEKSSVEENSDGS